MPFACFYLPVCLVPCLLPISVCPALCPLFCFFPVFRLPVCPGPLLFARFCLPPCPARCPFDTLLSALVSGRLPFLPLLFARVACGPLCPLPSPPTPGQWASWPPPASEKWQRDSSQTQTLPRVAAHFPRQMGRGALLARAIAAAAVPSFRLLAIHRSSCALSHSHSRTPIRSISRLRAYFGAVFCKNEVCRRRRRRREKKVGSSYSYLSGPDEDYFGSCVLPKSPLALSSPKTKAPTN